MLALRVPRSRLVCAALLSVLNASVVAGCGDDGEGSPHDSYDLETGGEGATMAGGTSGLAGAPTGGGAAMPGVGGMTTGGATADGGHATGGLMDTGGFGTGGRTGTGGANPGGMPTGGGPTGGAATGGSAAGGMETGGTPTGGSATGGAPAGGAETGGVEAGGTLTCDFSDPPANVAAWVEESWNAELGSNINSREAWLLDSVILGEGEINLCVRWGATSAPSAAVKSQIGPSMQQWFNDWFQALGSYGCFPYPDGISVKVTGWAVRSGNEGWVSDLGPDVAVYTETDGDGEPKCPDACSFFTNWNHQFPNCPGGEAFHTDYWIWLDDQLPGGGGAAAVGGDWGLRMPVGSLIDTLGNDSDGVIEHEMGHGFGFQDYYEWTGSTPEGGSLMIVGSSSQGYPTVGDTWLIRRTWREMLEIRGWSLP